MYLLDPANVHLIPSTITRLCVDGATTHARRRRYCAWSAKYFINHDPQGNPHMTKRIYTVTDLQNPSEPVRLISAATPASAIGHASRNRFAAKVATQADLVKAVKAGIEVENSDEEPEATQEAK